MAKLERDIAALVQTCEELVKDVDQRWRLTRYLKSIDGMLTELQD